MALIQVRGRQGKTDRRGASRTSSSERMWEELGRRGEGHFKDRSSMSNTIKTRQCQLEQSTQGGKAGRRGDGGMRAPGATLQGCTRRGTSSAPSRSPGQRLQLSEHQD